MEGSMSLSARKELSVCICRQQYQKASWREKRKILDGFIAATGYRRKYAIALINRPDNKDVRLNKRVKPIIYHDAVRQSLLTVWYAANQICSKRLVPFMPELVHKLESLGHLSLPSQTEELLLKMSISTVDRLLRAKRLKSHKGIITTRPGNLLKKLYQISADVDILALQRKVSQDSMISWNTNRHSVPWIYVGQCVDLRLSDNQLLISCKGKVIATHELIQGKYQLSVCRHHYEGLLRSGHKKPLKPPLYDPYWQRGLEVEIRDLAIYEKTCLVSSSSFLRH